MHRVQLNAYLVSGEPHLAIIPSVRFVQNPSKISVPKEVRVQRYQMKDFMHGERFDPGKLTKHLIEIWKLRSTWESKAPMIDVRRRSRDLSP